jgi:hypothetical protein
MNGVCWTFLLMAAVTEISRVAEVGKEGRKGNRE